MRRFSDYNDSVHQRVAPFKHWFLQTIGVASQFQGMGFGSKLLKPMFYKIGKERLPCYLETIDEKNVSLYEHFDFKIVDKSIVPETDFTNWAMLRETR